MKKIKHMIVIPATAPPDNCFPDEMAETVEMVGDEAPRISEGAPGEDGDGDKTPVAPGVDATEGGPDAALTGAVCPPPVPRKYPPPCWLEGLLPLLGFLAPGALGCAPGAEFGGVEPAPGVGVGVGNGLSPPPLPLPFPPP